MLLVSEVSRTNFVLNGYVDDTFGIQPCIKPLKEEIAKVIEPKCTIEKANGMIIRHLATITDSSIEYALVLTNGTDAFTLWFHCINKPFNKGLKVL